MCGFNFSLFRYSIQENKLYGVSESPQKPEVHNTSVLGKRKWTWVSILFIPVEQYFFIC